MERKTTAVVCELELLARLRFTTEEFLDRSAMPAGTVRYFNADRGFGFVTPNDGGDDIFVHISSIEKSGLMTVDVGDFLEFDVELDKRTGKFMATNLDLITPASGT